MQEIERYFAHAEASLNKRKSCQTKLAKGLAMICLAQGE
jgi:hypothetical protein